MFPTRGRRPLSEEEKSDDLMQARTRALEIAAAQELCSAQLYERLRRRFTDQTAAAVVAEMVECGEIDDARYAEMRVRSLLNAHKSSRAAAEDLRQKGLTAVQIQCALDAVYVSDDDGEDPELAVAVTLVKSRYRAKLEAGRRDLVFAALQRRGFSWTVIREAVRQVSDGGTESEKEC